MEKTQKVCDLLHCCPARLIKLCNDLGSWDKEIFDRKRDPPTKDIVGKRDKTIR